MLSGRRLVEGSKFVSGFWITDVVLMLGADWMTIFCANMGLNMYRWLIGTARL